MIELEPIGYTLLLLSDKWIEIEVKPCGKEVCRNKTTQQKI